MAKLAKYLLITSGILVLMYFGGVIGETGTLLSLLLHPENLTINGILESITLTAISQLTLAAGIIILALAYQRPDMIILSPISLMFFELITDILFVYNKIIDINTDYKIIGIILFAPIIVLLFLVVVDWWRGTD